MFLGEYTHTIDSKGRLAIPAKFRKALSSGAVLTRGLDNCLFLYPKSEWDKLAERLSKLPISQANTRAFARLMLAGAWEVEFDKQGRIFLPGYLRIFANIKKKAVVTGLFNRLEIWDDGSWKTYREGTEKSSSDIAEALGELGV
ncbi:MAG: division/cell wall cluster transcriptional repressor MraZ [Patescibacteria group bacterium]